MHAQGTRPGDGDEVDVVVVGAGVAGMTTALVAAAAGLSVVVLEKTGVVGGATAWSSGGAFLPGCHHLPADPVEPMRYLEHCAGGRLDRPIVEAYLANGPTALAFLEANTEVRYKAYGGVDYKTGAPGASSVPHTVLPVTYDAAPLGSALHRIRPPLPSMTILGGMQVDYADIARLLEAKSFRSLRPMLFAAELLIRHVTSRVRFGRSSRLVFGNALVGRLYKSVRDRSAIDVRFGARATELIVEAGRVAGVTYRLAGEERVLRAGRGVMLASGGFPANDAMRAARTPYAGEHLSMSPVGNVGDGIAMATRAGACLNEPISSYCYTPVSHVRTRRGEERRYPHFALDRCKPGAIAVGRDGRRFVNEGCVYSDFVPAMFAAKAVPAFLVCDHRFLRSYGLGMVLPAPFGYRAFVRRGYLVRGSTVEALADRLGVDPVGLADSVARNNAFAATGVDLDFGKGDDAYSRSLGDPSHGPNPCLGPIDRGPYYAIRIYPGDTATTCGLVVDPQARVLDANDRPIAGLFASGPDMANPTLGTNPSGGCNIGPALTFGYVAARAMAAPPGTAVVHPVSIPNYA